MNEKKCDWFEQLSSSNPRSKPQQVLDGFQCFDSLLCRSHDLWGPRKTKNKSNKERPAIRNLDVTRKGGGAVEETSALQSACSPRFCMILGSRRGSGKAKKAENSILTVN